METVADLRAKCKAAGLSGYSKLKKAELIELLSESGETVVINKPVKSKSVVNVSVNSILRPITNIEVFKLINDDNKQKTEFKTKIISLIKRAHNVLYNEENIEGEEALSDIMNFIFIKCIYPLLTDIEKEGKIDLFNKSYYSFKEFEYDSIFNAFNLENLIKRDNDELRIMKGDIVDNDLIMQMGEILKKHKLTGQIFTEVNFINAKKPTTVKSLLKIINEINIKEFEENEDVIGEIYEFIINGYLKKGSKLGQYFTPRKLMRLILQYKQNEISSIAKEGEPLKIIDTSFGTAGWLVLLHNMIKHDNILLSGGDVKPSTFKYGLMNLILTLKKMPHSVQCDSSLTHVDKEKHDIALTNPPFQTDKKFADLKANYLADNYNKINIDKIYELQNNNPPIQFLELNIYKLKKNGMCVIILPYGELFFSKTYKTKREYFMNTINITEIILFQGGTFTHTGIKTCAFIFRKNGPTESIKFLQANTDCNTLIEVANITISDIKSDTNYSWYLRDYLEDEYIMSLSKNITNFEWVEFGEVFDLIPGELSSEKVVEDDNGEGVLINWSKYDNYKKINECKLDGENLFISTAMPNGKNGGYIVIKYYEGKCDYVNLMSRMIINKKYNKLINLKFYYYYLKSIQSHIESVYERGSCNKVLDLKNFNRMKIPIPSLELQEKIMNSIHKATKSEKHYDVLINELIQNKFECLESIIKSHNCSITFIGNITSIDNGERITEALDGSADGEYPVYGGGGISYYTNKFNRSGKNCKISKYGMSEFNCVQIINGNFYLNDAGITIRTKNELILTNEYLWNYLLMIKSSIYKTGRGTAQAGIGIELMNSFNIKIPTIENQNIINDIMTKFDYKIRTLELLKCDLSQTMINLFTNNLKEYGLFAKTFDIMSNILLFDNRNNKSRDDKTLKQTVDHSLNLLNFNNIEINITDINGCSYKIIAAKKELTLNSVIYEQLLESKYGNYNYNCFGYIVGTNESTNHNNKLEFYFNATHEFNNSSENEFDKFGYRIYKYATEYKTNNIEINMIADGMSKIFIINSSMIKSHGKVYNMLMNYKDDKKYSGYIKGTDKKITETD